ncbi:MAG: sensor histidine kinase [Chitinophagales bacterium]
MVSVLLVSSVIYGLVLTWWNPGWVGGYVWIHFMVGIVFYTQTQKQAFNYIGGLLFLTLLSLALNTNTIIQENTYLLIGSLFGFCLASLGIQALFLNKLVYIESEIQQYKDLIDHMNDGLLYVDNNEKIQLVNPQFCALVGYTKEELIGKKASDLLLTEETKNLMEQQNRDREAGKTAIYDIPVRGKEGHIKWVRISGAPVYNHERKVIGSMGLHKDVTRRKIAEDAIKAYANQLEQTNEELKHFAYVVSHDLQAPLRTITSFIGLLKRHLKGQLDDTGLEFMQYAVDGANQMQHFIKALLRYSRIGRAALHIVPIKLKDLLEDIQFSLGERINSTNASFVFELEENVLVNGDKVQLTQLLQNLIDNGLKYQKENQSPIITIACKYQKGEMIIEVRDNGIGIKKEYQEKIFPIFQRLHTSQEYEGTGIGLSICKKIVERHGGRIWLESTFDVGTSFFVALPHKKGTEKKTLNAPLNRKKQNAAPVS